DSRATPGLPDRRGLAATLGRLGRKGLRERRDQLDLPDRREPPDRRGPRVRRVRSDLPASMLAMSRLCAGTPRTWRAFDSPSTRIRSELSTTAATSGSAATLWAATGASSS